MAHRSYMYLENQKNVEKRENLLAQQCHWRGNLKLKSSLLGGNARPTTSKMAGIKNEWNCMKPEISFSQLKRYTKNTMTETFVIFHKMIL